MIKIIINEWEGYPLYRDKIIGELKIECGLSRLLENINKFKAGKDFKIILVINTTNKITYFKQKFKTRFNRKSFLISSNKYDDLKNKYNFIDKILYHNNVGADLGAYNKAYKYLKHKKYNGDIVFMNSSVRGPSQDFWLSKYYNLFNKDNKVGVTGISINSHNTKKLPPVFSPHVQSFFIYSNMIKLKDVFKKNLVGYNKTKRLDLIQKGEILISKSFLDKGYGINCSMFPNFIYFKDQQFSIHQGDLRLDKKYAHLANLL